MTIERAVNLRDLEALAEEAMDPVAFSYYVSGAGDEDTLRANQEAFARWQLRPRVLVDVNTIDMATTVLGHQVTMPVGLAPTALHGLAHADGEVAPARAAAAAGVLFCSSSLATRPLEDVAEASPGPRWFQLYTHRDRAVTEDVVRRAVEADFTAMVLTVDLPVIGRREREARGGYVWPEEPAYGNFRRYTGDGVTGGLHKFVDTWADFDSLRSLAPDLPWVLKGILTAEDAVLAVQAGADAVWVSNHGGRQLDRVPAGIEVLEEIVDAVAGRAEVYLDGGIRRGTDVLTALALGARAVFMGRPYLYGLALAGEAGVARVLELLRAELEIAMALLGTPTPADVSRAHVRRAPG